MTSTSTPDDRPLRADARQNIEQILRVARTVFADLGYTTSIEEVARRSGLGVGTLYRHFPSKSSLVERVAVEVIDESTAEIAAAVREEPDLFSAFTRVARFMAAVRSSQLFPLSRGRPTEPGPRLLAARRAMLAALHDLVRQAQEAGELREDVTAVDVVVMLHALPPRWEDPSGEDPGADLAARHLGVLLDGLRPTARAALPGPPPTEDDLDRYFRSAPGP